MPTSHRSMVAPLDRIRRGIAANLAAFLIVTIMLTIGCAVAIATGHPAFAMIDGLLALGLSTVILLVLRKKATRR